MKIKEFDATRRMLQQYGIKCKNAPSSLITKTTLIRLHTHNHTHTCRHTYISKKYTNAHINSFEYEFEFFYTETCTIYVYGCVYIGMNMI